MQSWRTIVAPARALALACSLALGLPACSGDSGPATPTTPRPAGVILIDTMPDSCRITWELTDGNDRRYTGQGDSILIGVPPGGYEIRWDDLEGYYPPDPGHETRSVAVDETTRFWISYIVRQPAATIGIDVTPDDIPATWLLTDPVDRTHAGRGDAILSDLPAGDYEISWPTIEGHFAPDPPTVTLTAAIAETTTFAQTYVPFPPEPVYVLFLGSSYFGSNDLPVLFHDLAESLGKNVIYEAHVPSGNFLDYHVTSGTSNALIRSRAWDYVILQGVGVITAYPESAHFDLRAALATIAYKVYTYSNSEAKVMFQMAWAFEDGMLWTPGGTDDYFAMQQKVYDRTLEHADAVDIVVAPVGWAWNTIMRGDPPEHYLFRSDWNHPSLRGSYLMACVLYASVFLESALGAVYDAELPAGEVTNFQSVGSSLVLDDLELWHLQGDEE